MIADARDDRTPIAATSSDIASLTDVVPSLDAVAAARAALNSYTNTLHPQARTGGINNNKHKKHKDRGVKFNEAHALKYGLSVCSRNAKTGIVESVMCNFCVAFGKESASDATRKRRATANIKYFRQPFRADHYLSHLEINHRDKWSAYELASQYVKDHFFAAHIDEATLRALQSQQLTQHLTPPLKQQQPPHQRSNSAHTVDSTTHSANHHTVDHSSTSSSSSATLRVGSVRLLASEIERAIVNDLVGDLFYCNSTARQSHDSIEQQHAHALDVFQLRATDAHDNDDSANASYTIKIHNQRLFDLAMQFIARGASCRLTTHLLPCVRDETALACYNNATERKVTGFVRAVLASNLQRLALLLRASWSFALAFVGATHQQTTYVDVRVRLWHHNALHDVHVLTLPAVESTPAPALVARITRCLDVLDARWRAKLLGTTSSGCESTIDTSQALAASLVQCATLPNVYSIWCGVHALEQAVVRAVHRLCDGAFVDELVAVLAVLRQQPLTQDVVHIDTTALPDVSAAFTTVQSVTPALVQALQWLVEHRTVAASFLQTTAPHTAPGTTWWLCVAVAHRVLAEVACVRAKLTQLDATSATRVRDQAQELCKLTLVLADVVNARRELLDDVGSAQRDRNDGASVVGSFVVLHTSTQQLIQRHCGPLARELFDTLRGVDRVLATTSIARFAVELVAAVAAVANDGRRYSVDNSDSNSAALVHPPLVLPLAVAAAGKDAFVRVLRAQELRLLQTRTRADIDAIERDFTAFALAVEREPILHGVMQKHTRATDVSFAWSCLDGRFQLLQDVVGGLATVLPEAPSASLGVASGTFASDLALLNWEKPDYRETSIDFALEGILHARQKRTIELIDIQYLASPRLSTARAATTAPMCSPALTVAGNGSLQPPVAIATPSDSTGPTQSAAVLPLSLDRSCEITTGTMLQSIASPCNNHVPERGVLAEAASTSELAQSRSKVADDETVV